MRGRRQRRNIEMPIYVFLVFIYFFFPRKNRVSPEREYSFGIVSHTLSRKAPTGLRFTGLLSLMMDSAPRKWLLMTSEEPLRTIW